MSRRTVLVAVCLSAATLSLLVSSYFAFVSFVLLAVFALAAR